MSTANGATSWQPLEIKESLARVPPRPRLWLDQSTWSMPDRGPREEGCNVSSNTHRYNQRCIGRFDPNGDRSPSPPPPRPRAFSCCILRAPLPKWYKAPTNIAKYLGESNPNLSSGDYRLACHTGGADQDDIIIHNPPIFGRFNACMARELEAGLHPKLGRPRGNLCHKFPRHVRLPWKLVEPQELPTEA
jgi:hypothetical protein